MHDVMSLNWTCVDNVTSSTVMSPKRWSLNYSGPEVVIVSVILLAMILVTGVGNALVGVALLRFRSLRSVSNMLIGNLAVSDFLLAVVVLPLSTINETLGYWPLGHIACNVWLTVDVLCCTASIWNLCMIALDRYAAVVHPLWYHQKRSVRQVVACVSVVWIVSLTVSVPSTLFSWTDVYWSDSDDQTERYQCLLYQSPWHVLLSAMASFFLPFTITIFLYVRIFSVLVRRLTAARTASNTGRRSSSSVTGARRCRFVTELSTRQLPEGASISAELAAHHDYVAVEAQSMHGGQLQPSSTSKHVTINTTLRTVSNRPAVVSSCPRPRAQVVMTSEVDTSGRHSDSRVAKYRHERRQIAVSVRMALIVAVFGGMWFGFFVIYVLHSWCSTCYIPRQLDAFFFWLGYANSAANPVLYALFNSDFRRAFSKILSVCAMQAN